jgi:transposase
LKLNRSWVVVLLHHLTEVNHQQNGLNRRKYVSPDLNPIEMLWHDLKRAVHTTPSQEYCGIYIFVKRNGPKFLLTFAGVIRNYRKRLVEVIAAKGGSTCY